MFPFLASAGAEEVADEVQKAADPSWLQTVFAKFGEFTAVTWIIIAALVALGIWLLTVSKTQKKWNARMLSYAALSIALAFVLSYVRLYRMPQGGSVTLASMLPIMLFSACYGVGPGVLVGAAYGVLQYLQGGWFVSVFQFLLDYPLAYAALGLCGLYKKLPKAWGLYAVMVIAALVRALSATLAGYLFWDTAWWASVVYNGTYLIPDTIICILLATVVAKPVMKMMKA